MEELMNPEEGQKKIDKWFDNLPNEINKFYSRLTDAVSKVQTFDLLSCISYYNNSHDASTYSDDRGDKHFYVPEVLSLLCLKNEFVNETKIPEEEYDDFLAKVQKDVLNYCGRSDAYEFKLQEREDNAIYDIAERLYREAKQIRNPGLPDHHLDFSEKLFEGIADKIKEKYGFDVVESIDIRVVINDLINEKYKNAFSEMNARVNKYTKVIIKYRKTKRVEVGSVFTTEQLEEYSLLTDLQIKRGIRNHLFIEMLYKFSDVYTFTAEELSGYMDLDLVSVKSFLNIFSCGFPSLGQDDKIYEPITILKSRPILTHDGRYLLPSLPLLTWAVEDFLFDELFSNKIKLSKSISDIRHDFVLNEAFKYFNKILPTAIFFPVNLFYHYNGVKCETDGLILYDRTLFVVEAKGHRITSRAKSGDRVRTQKHLKQIIEDSYSQGVRAVDYIEQSGTAGFKPKGANRIEISDKDFDDVVLVSLTFEPIGNLSMLIKATNDIGFFNDKYFPFVLSIYDLAVLADLFDNPILFMYYIKQRNKFLTHKHVSTYEELDLLSYFMYNGLRIDSLLDDAKEKEVNRIELAPDTDSINDYYMYKFGHKEKYTDKPKFYLENKFNNFLLHLDNSRIKHRVKIGLILLEFERESIDKLLSYADKIKKSFSKDKKAHDCSIRVRSKGGVGVTIMTGIDKDKLSLELHSFCEYKRRKEETDNWIGLGDVSTNRGIFDFKAMYLSMKASG